MLPFRRGFERIMKDVEGNFRAEVMVTVSGPPADPPSPGSQVAYNGHPLYTYSGDSAPLQANGEGFGNVWFVVPTTLPTTTPSGSTPTPGGYYHRP